MYAADIAVMGFVCAWNAGFAIRSFEGIKNVRSPSSGRDTVIVCVFALFVQVYCRSPNHDALLIAA